MGGNSRKFKKSEKNKIKLKGAKLPKGTNVTKTNFKVRKIVLPDQIKQRNLTNAAVLSSRSLTVKDCLNKLSHANPSSKTEGLRGLREILSKLPTEVTEHHLNTAMKAIAGASIDVEYEVRRECYKTLSVLFASIEEEKLFPYFDVLLSFLRCAMTHIQPRIQEDSLLLLDTYLQHVPQIIIINRDKIFPQFLDMISKLRSESKPERTLTVNLNKSSTSTRWRVRVLTRLFGMLTVLIRHKKGEGQTRVQEPEAMDVDAEATPFATPSSNGTTKPPSIDNVFNMKATNYFPIIRQHLCEPCPLPALFYKSIGEGEANLSDQVDEGKKLKTYIHMLMPLLFESWLEVRPSTSGNKTSEHVLSQEAASTLTLLLDITAQLWELAVNYSREANNSELLVWYRQEYAAGFSEHILHGFPYNQSPATGRTKGLSSEQGKERNPDEKCYQQNFNICYIYCCLNETFRQDKNKDYDKVVNYIENCVTNWKFRSPDINALLLKVLRYMLLENECTSVNKHTRELLKTLLEAYIKGKLAQETRNRILIVFCDIIVLNDRLWKEYGQAIFTLWLRMLPNLLKKPSIDLNVVKALLCLAKQKNSIFLQSLEENAEEIVNNLSVIKVSNEQHKHEGVKSIINLLFWINKRELLERLSSEKQIELLAADAETKSYLQSTLQTRLAYL